MRNDMQIAAKSVEKQKCEERNKQKKNVRRSVGMNRGKRRSLLEEASFPTATSSCNYNSSIINQMTSAASSLSSSVLPYSLAPPPLTLPPPAPLCRFRRSRNGQEEETNPLQSQPQQRAQQDDAVVPRP
jgi:hypothetical protein